MREVIGDTSAAVGGAVRRDEVGRPRWWSRVALVAACAVVVAGATATSAAADVGLTLTVTSAVDESSNGPAEATIGEGVTLDLVADLPAGLTLDSGHARISLPAGLVTTGAEPTAELDGAELPAGSAVDVTADEVVVTLPSGHETGDGQALTVRVEARVADVAAAVHGALLEPAAEVALTPDGGAPQVAAGAWSITVVEPFVVLDGWDLFDIFGEIVPGEMEEYDLAVGNSGATGHDVVLSVTVDPHLHPRGGDGPAVDGELVLGAEWDLESRTLTWRMDQVPGGTWTELGRITVDVSTAAVHVPGRVLSTSRATATSMAGEVPYERTASSGISADRYATSLEHPKPFVTPGWGGIVVPDAEIHPGDIITVTQVVTIPAHVSTNDLTLATSWPAVDEVLDLESVTCTPGCAVGAMPFELGDGDQAWFLGDVAAADADRDVRITYRAQISPDTLGDSFVVVAGRVAMNADDLVGDPPTVPDPDAEFQLVTGPPSDEYPWIYITEPAPAPTASVAGGVWVDRDRDGVRDRNERGARRVLVRVTDLGADGRRGGGDDQTVTVRTGKDGTFRAAGLRAGSYVVTVDPRTFPRGTTAWWDTDGGRPTSTSFTLAPGEARTGVDFALRTCRSPRGWR
ncbi:hypothetical protein ICW40_09500 [Actinotalea ferrariae]|uniref:SdrD B-like domain-containing protein n=1 Tax=Actinotalea ferrariae TaxID=1386098 RepID=UPI001C8C2015|nr:SdrD B-like domain-containing protein [Actinotalea ferrariae]MBX9245043.1 hypothetical protein [Actinotalea ferrariae]